MSDCDWQHCLWNDQSHAAAPESTVLMQLPASWLRTSKRQTRWRRLTKRLTVKQNAHKPNWDGKEEVDRRWHNCRLRFQFQHDVSCVLISQRAMMVISSYEDCNLLLFHLIRRVLCVSSLSIPCFILFAEFIVSSTIKVVSNFGSLAGLLTLY